jgi:hypothetical protein
VATEGAAPIALPAIQYGAAPQRLADRGCEQALAAADRMGDQYVAAGLDHPDAAGVIDRIRALDAAPH